MNAGAVKAAYGSEWPTMQAIAAIGLGIAKSVFQVHCVNASGQGVIRRQLKRGFVRVFFAKTTPFHSH